MKNLRGVFVVVLVALGTLKAFALETQASLVDPKVRACFEKLFQEQVQNSRYLTQTKIDQVTLAKVVAELEDFSYVRAFFKFRGVIIFEGKQLPFGDGNWEGEMHARVKQVSYLNAATGKRTYSKELTCEILPDSMEPDILLGIKKVDGNYVFRLEGSQRY